MITLQARTLMTVTTVTVALVLSACPGPDADREAPEERPDAVALEETDDAAAEDAEPTEAAPTSGWTARMGGAEHGTFQGETVTREESPQGIALRLASEEAEPPITLMLLLPDLEEGTTGSFQAANASLMIGATGYFHAPDQATHFEVDIYEHRDGRLTGTFTGMLRTDGPGDPLELEGSFETENGEDI